MAVFRSDQAQLTFGVEASIGGDPEMMEGTAGSVSTTINAAFEAGSRSITVADGSALVVGDMIRIGTVAGTESQTVNEHEVRRVEFIEVPAAGNTRTLVLDRPTAFYHASGQECKEITAVGGTAGRNDANKLITWIPGVYETVDTPDPEMTIEPRRFLGTQSKRNFAIAYKGQQTMSGGVTGIVLLNGWPLRFPIGQVASTASDVSGSATITLGAEAKKGSMYITVSATHGLAAGDFIVLYDTAGLAVTKAEVRKVEAVPTTNVMKLNSPLQFTHPSGAGVREVAAGSKYTHVITEATELDTVSWHVHMRDSGETAANDFDRRYVGGMIGSAGLSAEEGGLVTMNWDSVNFIDMVHNQNNQTGSQLYSGASVTASMPRFALMQAIDVDDVGQPGLNDGTGFPTTEPYYFSQGQLKFFGQEFARVRSFSLSISNGEEPRYYIGRSGGGRHRGPSEIFEGAREYTVSCSVTLPDTAAANSSSQAAATELFKQLLLEGDFGGTSAAQGMAGFTMSLRFDRGADDNIIIDIPGSTTAGTPTTATAALNSQGAFIRTAPHSITADNPFQVDLDILARAVKITVNDSVPVYP
ncbi:hypothetical protein CMI37_04275 [Candidatus Pacearchaeota archaeon]|nr:hypothetical protein [Candidatus Pacearchaeota archaeon]